MFDIVRKAEFFDWWERGVVNPHRHDLKSFQDAWITTQLQGVTGKRILEIGGLAPRVLLQLAEHNTCVNADPEQPDTNLPDTNTHENLSSVPVLLGQFDPRLKDNSFDIAFSISVMEHVPCEQLDACFADTARVLKPAGRLLHAIDIYLASNPTVRGSQRVNDYCSAAEKAGLKLEQPRTLDPDPAFTADMCSNPDFTMARWNKVAPSLISVRKTSQCVSLIGTWTKPE